MSESTFNEETFASGRYSKRKRTQVTYHMDELDFSDSESDYEGVQAKQKRKAIAKRLPKNKTFPFMELPAEIRNMIYAHALHDDNGVHLVATFKHKRRTVERVSVETADKIGGGRRSYSAAKLNDEMRAENEEPKPLVPSLLAVSQQINQEARDFLYGNDFICADTFALYSFLLNIGPVGAKLLQSVRIMSWGYGRALKGYNHSCFAVLAWATNLKTLYVDNTPGYSQSPKNRAEQFYRDAFPWLEAVGAAKRKSDAAVELVQFDAELFDYSYWDGTKSRIVSGEERLQLFRDRLSELLGAQQKWIMAKPAKKRKIKRDGVVDEV
ncbi:hypothetical protein EK21DRAFT_71880 [Setomelanomma holmii]|uniref:DUF7730 domain-containing protein n=1 Tax=Setomelanomma holmii TaxID=210430 RepID=A0A9P4H5F2_9PLEO|nr:hypothetical protein EK21DRAFT_71880 [Setomelanomma holmii]